MGFNPVMLSIIVFTGKILWVYLFILLDFLAVEPQKRSSILTETKPERVNVLIKRFILMLKNLSYFPFLRKLRLKEMV